MCSIWRSAPDMSMDVRATPAIALGAADATPIEVASAYTMFANRGIASKPKWIRMIRSHKGDSIYEAQAATRRRFSTRA